MPPRVCGPSLPAIDATLCQVVRAAAPTTTTTTPCHARSFTTTQSRAKITVARHRMYKWLERHERDFNEANGPSYLGPHLDQPFPNNPLFRSQPVLSEPMRNDIYNKVINQGQALKAVSQEMQVDVNRVAAVVRLKQVEQNMIQSGKRLAIPYAKAVMGMLPKSFYKEGEKNAPHEPINDIPVHKLTLQQLFVPVSESRHFTREDAARAFHEQMLPADVRSPQRGLIEAERRIVGGQEREESIAKFRVDQQKEELKHAQKLAEKAKREAATITKVKTDRYEFRIKQINSEDVGRHGRSRRAVGWRYGAPLQDRKRGMIKIPTSVP